ncbi:MAG: response regulator transcription factor [Nitrospinae bacterium]|nr:response regulator transcription factor [Nitrospinota bacterium]
MSEQKPLPKLLVVDDEPEPCEAIADYFRRIGHSVQVAGSGGEAIDIARSFGPDIVFLDVRLPGMSGIETLRELKRSPRGMEVIMVTGFADLETAVSALRHGACDYLRKPFNDLDLLVAYDRAVERIDDRLNAQKSLDEAKAAISGLARSSVDDREKLLALLRDKLENIVYPQLEQLTLQVADAGTQEALHFVRYLLDSIIPGTSRASKLDEIMMKLTPTERNVAKMLIQGKNPHDIAVVMNRSVDTIYTHQKRIRKRLGLTNLSISLTKYLLSPVHADGPESLQELC